MEKNIIQSQFDDIVNNVFNSLYEFQYDSTLHRHHLNYILDITISLCNSCHSKVYNSSDKKYSK